NVIWAASGERVAASRRSTATIPARRNPLAARLINVTLFTNRADIYSSSMLQPDTQLGAYRLLHRIGAGGMGEVWKAEDTRLGRVVAIKVLPPSVASDNEAVARMRREARTAAQLYHHNIATIHSIEQEGDRLFIVMEFVDG